jgi:hypothetical protein
MRLHGRISRIRCYLDGKQPIPKHTSAEELRQELREKLRLRRRQPRLLPRRVIYYVRYADDLLVILCNTSKAEARQIKAEMADWMQTNLGLTLNQDKTLITHWRKLLRFLGYILQGRANRNGTRWLHFSVPKSAVREVVAKIARATAYPQAPAYDVFVNVNAVARGWMNYYRYAHNNNVIVSSQYLGVRAGLAPAQAGNRKGLPLLFEKIHVIGGKLSMVIFWRTAHYLGKKHRRSIAKVMRTHYDRDPKTGCKALFIHKPGKPPSPETRYFIWHKTPQRLSLASATVSIVQDKQAYINTNWAKGRSQHKRLETRAKAADTCQHCGATGEPLFVHHPNVSS